MLFFVKYQYLHWFVYRDFQYGDQNWRVQVDQHELEMFQIILTEILDHQWETTTKK